MSRCLNEYKGVGIRMGTNMTHEATLNGVCFREADIQMINVI